MKVTITARHAKFTDTMKNLAYQKAHRLEHFFDHLTKIEVVLDLEGDKGYRVEMIAHGLHDHVLFCHASAQTALTALDMVLEKMERQLIKYKEKMTRRHHVGAGAKTERFQAAKPETEEDAPEGRW